MCFNEHLKQGQWRHQMSWAIHALVKHANTLELVTTRVMDYLKMQVAIVSS